MTVAISSQLSGIVGGVPIVGPFAFSLIFEIIRNTRIIKNDFMRKYLLVSHCFPSTLNVGLPSWSSLQRHWSPMTLGNAAEGHWRWEGLEESGLDPTGQDVTH